MNAAIYRRVSTDHQDGSLETQEKRIADYLAFKGLTVAEGADLSDPDTSGTIELQQRDGGRRLLNLLQHGHIQHLVVAKLDRLGRNAKDVLDVVQRLKEMNVILHIVDMGGDSLSTQGPVGKFFISILASVAELEREMIVSRIRDRLNHKFDKGELIGTLPYGFQLAPGRNRTLEACPEQVKWIHYMAQRRALGLGYHTIAKELNGLGVPSKSGKTWQAGNVAGVLQSRHTQKVLATPATP